MFAFDNDMTGVLVKEASASPPVLAGHSSRYGQKVDWQSRCFALTLSLAVYALIIVAWLVIWRDPVAVRPTSSPVSVTLLPLEKAMPPASRPKVPRPRQLLKPPRPVADAPTISPTIVATAPAPQVTAVVLQPQTLPAPPEAPSAIPVSRPPARVSASWESLVLGKLEAAKRYPASARSRRDQGVATVRFELGREGQLLSVVVARSSGSHILDEGAVSAVRRAAPFPPIPIGRPDKVELVVPIEFYLH